MNKLLSVQKQIGTLSKKSTNPFFNSKYLDLQELLESIRPLVNKEGLLLLQPIENNCVCTVVIDAESGEKIAESSIQLPEIKNPQQLGSAITYFRRYTLKSLFAIAEEDDDGNKASAPSKKQEKESTIIQDLLDCETLEDLKEVWTSKKGHTNEEVKLKNELKEKLL